jgi:hypothetical protein
MAESQMSATTSASRQEIRPPDRVHTILATFRPAFRLKVGIVHRAPFRSAILLHGVL